MRFICIGFAGLLSVYPAMAAERPNILFILADDLGYGGLGCYGQKKVPTPSIDRLAAEGTRFTSFYSGSTVCAPARCCLMTGKHTGHATVRGNARVPLPPEEVTVAEVLKKAGYTTGIVGKWGLGEPDSTGIPNRQGFDYWFGYLNQHHAHDYYPTYLWRNETEVKIEGNLDGKKGQYSHDLFTEEALSFIERSKGGPFFLYLAYTIPHANNELKGKTGDGMEVPDYGSYAAKDWTNSQKGHAAMIERMDRDIARVMARIKGLGLDEKTIVLFSSDNGPHQEGGYETDFFDSRGPLRGIKRDLHEGGIRVPMIVRWPGKVKAGATSEQVWAMWDFLPTAAQIAGAEPPPGIDGISMLPAILGQSQKDHEFLYWEFTERGFSQAVRMGEWKAVRKRAGAIELYNLRTDLGETKDVAGEHTEVATKIEAYLETARTPSEHFPNPPKLSGANPTRGATQ